ncbi:hypothetical protein D3C86_1522830 [compost metagenome]
MQGIARSQHARIFDQGHIQGGVEIIRQAWQDRQRGHIGGRLADHGGIGRARHRQLRLGVGQIGVRLGQTGFRLGYVGASDLAHFEASVGFIQLATQDGDVLLADAQDFHVAHHVGIGLDDRGHHLLLDLAQVFAAGADISFGGVDAARGAARRPDVLRQADAGGSAIAFHHAKGVRVHAAVINASRSADRRAQA